MNSLAILCALSVSIIYAQQLFDLRLLNNVSFEANECMAFGRVEIFFNNTWGTICDDDITDEQDNGVWDVICNQLGYQYVIMGCSYDENEYPGCATLRPQFPTEPDTVDIIPVWLDNLECIGNETNLNECQHNDFGDENCGHDEDIGVVCANSPCTLIPAADEPDVDTTIAPIDPADDSESSDDSFDAAFVAEKSMEDKNHGEKMMENKEVTIRFADNMNITIIFALCLCLFSFGGYLLCFHAKTRQNIPCQSV